eukprot:3226084-Alexandrium_andersonii.AAC.1
MPCLGRLSRLVSKADKARPLVGSEPGPEFRVQRPECPMGLSRDSNRREIACWGAAVSPGNKAHAERVAGYVF